MRNDTLIPPESSQFVSAASLRVRLDWFNKLRWGAVIAVLVAIIAAGALVRSPLPEGPMLIIAAVLILLNLLYTARNRRIPPTTIRAEIRVVKLQMTGDLVVLTVLLNLTGGVENPLLFVYVVHVIIASLLFKGREIFTIAWLAIALFTGAVLGEYLGLLPHHHLLSASEMTHELPYILTTVGSFWLVMLTTAYMGSTIMGHNRAIKDELVERQRALISADNAKMDFFRFVTHEVKSPVNTAQSAVETAIDLGGKDLSPQVEDMLSRAVGRLEQATEIVKDLADLTRGDMLKRENMQPLDVKAVVVDEIEHLRDLASRRGITFEPQLPDDPVVMKTSRGMLQKILVNLLSNAVRYNRDGGMVKVRLEDTAGPVRIEVEDQGIGIAPADRERIFEEFYRAPAAQELTTLGTGLGLPIVRRFVASLGGDIKVISTPGEGSTFRIDLPRTMNGGGGRPGGGTAETT